MEFDYMGNREVLVPDDAYEDAERLTEHVAWLLDQGASPSDQIVVDTVLQVTDRYSGDKGTIAAWLMQGLPDGHHVVGEIMDRASMDRTARLHQGERR